MTRDEWRDESLEAAILVQDIVLIIVWLQLARYAHAASTLPVILSSRGAR